jgi:hypothetical protein
MIIANYLVIILTLVCFIIGMIVGDRLMWPHYYSSQRGHTPSSSRRYDD